MPRGTWHNVGIHYTFVEWTSDPPVRWLGGLFVLLGLTSHLFREQVGTCKVGMGKQSLKAGCQSVYSGSKFPLYSWTVQVVLLSLALPSWLKWPPSTLSPNPWKLQTQTFFMGCCPYPQIPPTNLGPYLLSIASLTRQHLGEGKGKASGKLIRHFHWNFICTSIKP